MRLKIVLITIIGSLVMLTIATSVIAQGTPPVPPPYAGIKNPFPWDDKSAQDAGKKLYNQQCSGCHGAGGSGIPSTDFSQPAYAKDMETAPDYHYWILTEGNLPKGMPGYKSSLSDEQRWQTLTYVHLLGISPVPAAPTTTPPATIIEGTITITVPEQAQAGQTVSLGSTLKDLKGDPIKNTRVVFFANADFFAKGLMELGDALTDEQGKAEISFVPRIQGDTQITARAANLAATTSLPVNDGQDIFYQTHIGIKLPTAGKEIFIGPKYSKELNANADAPQIALRLPGGTLSWVLFLVAAVVLAWSVCFIALFHVSHISRTGKDTDTTLRIVPVTGMVLVAFVTALFIFMIITGPYSQFNVLP